MNTPCPDCGSTRRNTENNCANLACRSRQPDLRRELFEQTRTERAQADADHRADMERTEPYGPTGLFVASNGRRSASVAFELVRRAKGGAR